MWGFGNAAVGLGSGRIPQIGTEQREPKAMADHWVGSSTECQGGHPGNCTFSPTVLGVPCVLGSVPVYLGGALCTWVSLYVFRGTLVCGASPCVFRGALSIWVSPCVFRGALCCGVVLWMDLNADTHSLRLFSLCVSGVSLIHALIFFQFRIIIL